MFAALLYRSEKGMQEESIKSGAPRCASAGLHFACTFSRQCSDAVDATGSDATGMHC